jgi:hypothetical protein
MSYQLYTFSKEQIDDLFYQISRHEFEREIADLETFHKKLYVGKSLFEIIGGDRAYLGTLAKLNPIYEPIEPLDDFFEEWFISVSTILSGIWPIGPSISPQNMQDLENLFGDAQIFLEGNRLTNLERIHEVLEDKLSLAISLDNQKTLFLPRALSKYIKDPNVNGARLSPIYSPAS